MQIHAAFAKIKWFNERKVHASLSYLPVEARSKKDVLKNEREYIHLLGHIAKQKLDSDVTLKLHQFGVRVSLKEMSASVERVVKEAKHLGNFVWIDMELPSTVDATLNLYEKLYKKYGNVGICIQAYLKRSEDDLKRLLKHRVPVRLVKGFYKNSDFRTWRSVTANYSKLMEMVLRESKRPCIATHDLRLIARAKKIMKRHHLKNAELQFFNHVRDSVAVGLAKEGFKVRVYVPYGHLFAFLWKGGRTFDFIHGMERLLHFKVR